MSCHLPPRWLRNRGCCAAMLFVLSLGCAPGQVDSHGATAADELLRSAANVTAQVSVSPETAQSGDTVTVTMQLDTQMKVFADVELTVRDPSGAVGYQAQFPTQQLDPSSPLVLTEAIEVESTDAQGDYSVDIRVVRTGGHNALFQEASITSFSVSGSSGPNGLPTGPVSLSWASPARGASVSGMTQVTLTGANFLNVEIFQGGSRIATCVVSSDHTSATASLDTTKYADGSLTLTAHAWNSPAGQPATSEADAGSLTLNVWNAENIGHYAIGMYVDEQSIDSVSQAIGRPIDVRQEYNWRNDWDAWLGWDVREVPLVLSIGLIPDSGADLVSAARGDYDQYYEQMAINLNQRRSEIAAVRIGWEFNGNWFAWSISHDNATADPDLAKAYVGAFRRLAGFIRQYAPWCLIDWCINQMSADASLAYPGDDVVDIIGLDIYEQNIGNFDAALSNDQCLTWLDQFSQSTYGANAPAGATGGAKLMSLPEWQATNGDATYVSSTIQWLNARANRISYMAYWNSDSAVQGGGALYNQPALMSAFADAYSGTRFTGTLPLSK